MKLVEATFDSGKASAEHLLLQRGGMAHLVQQRPARAHRDGQGKQEIEPRAFSSAADQIQHETAAAYAEHHEEEEEEISRADPVGMLG